MKKILIFFIVTYFFTAPAFSQIKFNDETKKYIEYNDPITVFKNGLLIDGKGSAAKPHQTIIISNGKINWVGDDEKSIIPKGAAIVDLNGKAIMPGLVMLHEHMYISAHSIEPRYANLRQVPFTFPRLYLAAGATTIRTCGSIEPYSDIRIKKDIYLGLLPGPNMELTAPYIEGKSTRFPQMKENKTPEEDAAFVNYWADQGFTSFKAYMGVDKLTLKAAIDAVHKRQLKITGHLDIVTYKEAALLGMDNLEHGFMASTDFAAGKKENEPPAAGSLYKALSNLDIQSDSVKQFIQFLIDKKMSITSSLAVFEGSTTTQPQPNQDALNAMSPDTRDYYLQRLATTLDSLINMVHSPSATINTNDLYYYARLASKNDIFPANTRTIDQMKNSGGFRLIRNEQVANAIILYYSELPQIQSLELTEQSETNEYRKIAVQIFSAFVFNEINSTNTVVRPVNNPALRNVGNKILGDLAGWVHYIKNTRIGLAEYKNTLLEKGEKLILLINEQYHLKNE